MKKEPPFLELVEGSEIEATVDMEAIGLDRVKRPVFINQEMDFMQLTFHDAKRLLAFLNEAIPYLEDWETLN